MPFVKTRDTRVRLPPPPPFNNNYIVNNGKGPFDDSYDLEIFHLYENIINNNR